MALVSLHLVQPSLPAPILARLADTLIGAAIAHLFSYVWPHWEFGRRPGSRRGYSRGSPLSRPSPLTLTPASTTIVWRAGT